MIISDANSCDNNITNTKENQQKLGYVYRHVRLDTNMPFYIGIGAIGGGENKRAYDKVNRSNDWKDIISSTEYRVEIILKNISYKLAKEKEKYFIKLYGRIDLGTGTLVNKTSGGQGSFGRFYSEETRKKIGKHGIGRKMSNEARKKISEDHKGNKYNLGRKLSTEHIEKVRMANIGRKQPKEAIEKTRKANTGKRHTEESKKKMSLAKKGITQTQDHIDKKSKPVGKYKDDILIKYYHSIQSVKLDGYHPGHVSYCCLGKYRYKSHKGFQWKFIE